MTLDAVLVGIAGMGLTFGMWWVYYLVPSGEILQRHRKSRFRLGLRPDVDRDLDRRNWRRSACSGVFHRTESPHCVSAGHPCRGGPPRDLSWVAPRAVLLPGSTFPFNRRVAVDLERRCCNARGNGGVIRHQHRGRRRAADPEPRPRSSCLLARQGPVAGVYTISRWSHRCCSKSRGDLGLG